MSTECLNPVWNPTTQMFVRCRTKCENCLKNNRNGWAYRMDRELKNGSHLYASFVTLTYQDSDLLLLNDPFTVKKYHFKNPLHYALINHDDWSNFLSDLQKWTKLHSNGKLQRYYTLYEYGSVEKRPHIHIILFSPLDEFLTQAFIRAAWDKISKDSIIDFQPITFADITYCAKHNLKETGGNKLQNFMSPPFVSCSRRNGGIGIAEIFDRVIFNDNFAVVNNFRVNMPDFYRKKAKANEFIEHLDPFLKGIILSNPDMYRKLVSDSSLQRSNPLTLRGLSQKQATDNLSKVREYYRIRGKPQPTEYQPHEFIITVVRETRQQNRELRFKRFCKEYTKTKLKIKHLHYVSSNSTNR